MDWRNYLSVMTPCAASGNIVFNFTTYDANPNVSLTITVSALATDNEVSLARRIHEQVNVQLIQASAQYNNIPVFSNYTPNATFSVWQTDHIVSVWSQSTFLITEVSNTTGATIQISANPTFVTLAQAQSLGPLLGSDFTDSNETALSGSQIMTVLQLASNQICGLIKNNLVIANYLMEYIGNMEGSVFLTYGPVVNYDTPVILPPIYAIVAQSYYIYLYPFSFQVNRKLKLLNYRFNSQLMGGGDPFEMNNEVKMTYRAGYMNIPSIIKEKTLIITSLMLNDGNISELKGGSFAVKFRLPIDTLKSISAELSGYKV